MKKNARADYKLVTGREYISLQRPLRFSAIFKSGKFVNHLSSLFPVGLRGSNPVLSCPVPLSPALLPVSCWAKAVHQETESWSWAAGAALRITHRLYQTGITSRERKRFIWCRISNIAPQSAERASITFFLSFTRKWETLKHDWENLEIPQKWLFFCHWRVG